MLQSFALYGLMLWGGLSLLLQPAHSAPQDDPLLNRPLFMPDRRLPATRAMPDHTEALPVLSGIIINGTQKAAVFQNMTSSGPSRPLQQGETISGWTLLSITPTSVMVQRDTTRKVLHPPFTPSTAGAETP